MTNDPKQPKKHDNSLPGIILASIVCGCLASIAIALTIRFVMWMFS